MTEVFQFMAVTRTAAVANGDWTRDSPARVADDEEAAWINGDGDRLVIKKTATGAYKVDKTCDDEFAWTEPGFDSVDDAKRYVRVVTR